MIDTTQIDLLQLCGRNTNLKHAANTRGGEYAGPCPKCGGEDRFRVQPAQHMWCCRQCHSKWGDAIEYVKWFDGVDFKTAVSTLKLPLDSRPYTPSLYKNDPDAPKPLGAEYAALNDPDWQEGARVFCAKSFDALWSTEGAKALDYLLGRGISEGVIESAGLGYNSTDCSIQWGLTEIWLPRGIIIPWLVGGMFWRVNCRPPQPINGKKYIQAAGSANGLYNADAVRRFRTVVMTEGEFDSLIVRTYAPEFVAVATGTVSWSRVTRWVSRLSIADEVLLSFDTDDAGEGAVTWWQKQLGSKATRLAPTDHDVNDMWKHGQDIAAWLNPFAMSFSMPITEDMEARRQAVREQTIWWLAQDVEAA
jgi:DNA primase